MNEQKVEVPNLDTLINKDMTIHYVAGIAVRRLILEIRQLQDYDNAATLNLMNRLVEEIAIEYKNLRATMAEN